MNNIKVFHYVNRVNVVMTQSLAQSYGYSPMYTTNIKLQRGINNKLQFKVLNQEQRPIDLTNLNLKFRIINHQHSQIVIEKQVDAIYALTGIAEVELTELDMIKIPAQDCSFSLVVTKDGNNYPLYTNLSGTANGAISVVNEVVPRIRESIPITVPTTPEVTSPYYTDAFMPLDTVTTIQYSMTDFSGDVQVMGSLTGIGSDPWYVIESSTPYENVTGSDVLTITGQHVWVRLKITHTTGAVSNLYWR